jgi:hypothetical protein
MADLSKPSPSCPRNLPYISGIERAPRNVGFENLHRVAHGLGVDLPTLTTAVEARLGRHAGAR